MTFDRIHAFCSRNRKEMVRDPLSYLFCLAFPLVMLLVMTVVNASIPPEAGITVFRIDNLCAGIAIFGQTFIMLFTALSVSKDRAGSFLVRMYATPMTHTDFTVGYMLPMLLLGLAQSIIILAFSLVLSLFLKAPLPILGLLLCIPVLLPSCLLFIALGLLAGTLFGEKSAPGLCSIIISLASFLGGIWFDADATGGAMLTLCRATPFYYCTKSARSAIHFFNADLGNEPLLLPLVVVICCALICALLSALVFRTKMKADLS